MRRVPPSVMGREKVEQALLSEGLDASKEETDLLFTLARLGLSYLVQQAFEQEQEDFLGGGHYERRQTQEQMRRGYGNSYEEVGLATAEGKVEVRVPQVRGTSEPHRSRLMESLSGNSEVLERLVVEMYARVLSSRDVEECFRNEAIGELLISRSAVSEITDQLWEDYRAFCERDLSQTVVEYLFLDAVYYESLRCYGAK